VLSHEISADEQPYEITVLPEFSDADVEPRPAWPDDGGPVVVVDAVPDLRYCGFGRLRWHDVLLVRLALRLIFLGLYTRKGLLCQRMSMLMGDDARVV
jgi:hypothetical protein